MGLNICSIGIKHNSKSYILWQIIILWNTIKFMSYFDFVSNETLLEDYQIMINDHARNEFYERMIRRNVGQKSVLDIGFGTGLLSFLAIQNNAKNVVSFEQRLGMYQLGADLLKHLNLENKIKLINDRFNAGKLIDPIDVAIHEILAENIWGEYMYYAVSDLDIPIYPNIYQLEIKCAPLISHEFFPANQESQKLFNFNPGVEIDPNIITQKTKFITNAMLNKSKKPLINTKPSVIQNSEFYNQFNTLASYKIDFNTKKIETQSRSGGVSEQTYKKIPNAITLDLDFKEVQNYILWFEYKVGDNTELFSLTQNYPGKSWDQFAHGGNPIAIHVDSQLKVKFSQDITNGKYILTY